MRLVQGPKATVLWIYGGGLCSLRRKGAGVRVPAALATRPQNCESVSTDEATGRCLRSDALVTISERTSYFDKL